MKFDFVAKTSQGEIKSGIVDSPTKELAVNDLQGAGLVIISITSRAAAPKFIFGGGIEKRELAFFTRQLAALINAHVPLIDTLRSLYKQTTNFLLKDALFESVRDVEGGLSLSQAFSRHKNIFSNYYIQILEIAELTGNLDESLNYLANYLERESTLESRTKGVLTYPAIVFAVFVIILLVLFAWLIPKISQFFVQANVELPLITKIFMGISNFVITWWWLIIMVFGLFVYLVFIYGQTNEGRAFFDETLLNLPYFGDLFKKIYLTRFSETVSTLIRGGIPIAQAIEISSEVIGNQSYAAILSYATEVIKRGGKLSELFVKYPKLFTPAIVQMIETGEKTGKLSDLLDKAANYYQQDVDRLLNSIVDTLQPILIIILGVAVGLLEISIFLPIYTLTKTIGAGAL